MGADPVEVQEIACRFCGHDLEQAGEADTSDVIVSLPPRLDIVGLTSPEYDRVELEVLEDWLAYWERVATGTEEPTPWSGETIEMAPGEIEKLAGEISARQAPAELEPRTAQLPHASPVAAVSTQHTSPGTASARRMSPVAKTLLISGVVFLGAFGLWSLSPGGSDIPISGSVADPGPANSDGASSPDDGYVPVKPQSKFPDGDYFVGVDMPVGRYVATGGNNCRWERRDEVANLLGSGVSTGGPVRVTVKDGDWFSTHRCGIWTRSPG